jgi:hypothetical protein
MEIVLYLEVQKFKYIGFAFSFIMVNVSLFLYGF